MIQANNSFHRVIILRDPGKPQIATTCWLMSKIVPSFDYKADNPVNVAQGILVICTSLWIKELKQISIMMCKHADMEPTVKMEILLLKKEERLRVRSEGYWKQTPSFQVVCLGLHVKYSNPGLPSWSTEYIQLGISEKQAEEFWSKWLSEIFLWCS